MERAWKAKLEPAIWPKQELTLDAPARNRITPTGEIRLPLRGAWTGNRGILHRGNDIIRFHASDLWITCALEFRGRRQEQWQPHHYTFLFFHDEAVSFGAGHVRAQSVVAIPATPIASLGRAGSGVKVPSAKQMNQQLHGERIVPGT